MFYKKINLRKLYEAVDNPIEMEDNPDIVTTETDASTDNEFQSTESSEREKEETNKAMKGMTYAFPINEEDFNQLTALIDSGSGEWISSTPLNTIFDPNLNAMMDIGGQSKPVYLKIILTQTKKERSSIELDLEGDDRVYVALITSPTNLKDNLNTAADISNYVKLSVKTPFIKNGTNIEHSLHMWKNFESDEDDLLENVEYNIDNIEQIQSESTDPEFRGTMLPAVRIINKKTNNKSTSTFNSDSSPIIIDDLSKVEAGTVLKLGRSGKAVEEIQTILGITVDGKFGPQTKEAVEKFQQENGLIVDGIVGKNTLAALRKKKLDAAEAEAKAKADAAASAAEAEAKAKADVAAKIQMDDKDLDEMNAEELRAELNKSKEDLKAARRDARQKRRSNRQEDRLRRRVEKIQKKMERVTNESKIYNFDEFVKIVHGFQSK